MGTVRVGVMKYYVNSLTTTKTSAVTSKWGPLALLKLSKR